MVGPLGRRVIENGRMNYLGAASRVGVTAHELRPVPAQVSLFHVSNLPIVPPPTTACRLLKMAWFASGAYRVVQPTTSLSRDQSVIWASPIRCRLATTTGRIEFVILRTNGSLSVALHLLSRERSYFRLRNSGRVPTRTCTLLIRYTHTRTTPGPSARRWFGLRAWFALNAIRSFGPHVVRRPPVWMLSASHLWRAAKGMSRRDN
jgi:hypothetical protein